MRKQDKIKIRKFKKQDLAEVRILIDETIDTCYSDIYCAEALRFFKQWHNNEKILGQAKEGYTVVLERNNQVIGTGTIVGNEAVRVFVSPEFQKHGFGKLIMYKLEERAISKGITALKLDASVPSRSFYNSLGYVTLEETFLEVENSKRLDHYKMEKTMNVNPIIIRQAEKADLDILLSLIRNSFNSVAKKLKLTVENCPKYVAFYTKERLLSDFEKGMKYYILLKEGQPCGCVALEKAKANVCYLERLAVLPEYRKKGYGAMLVNHIFKNASRLGAKRMELAMIAKDKKLKNWYKKFGFVQKCTRKIDHLPFIVAFMYKDL
jgi:N-acetylglutamate synthase-like GNAT family acetyltransferase